MKTTKRILLYGYSLILGTIGASLRLYPQFDVATLIPLQQETQHVDAAETDALLFDLATTRPESVFPLLGTNPTLQLIGISPDTNLIRVWSTMELREVSMGDLIRVIESEAKDLPAHSGGR